MHNGKYDEIKDMLDTMGTLRVGDQQVTDFGFGTHPKVKKPAAPKPSKTINKNRKAANAKS